MKWLILIALVAAGCVPQTETQREQERAQEAEAPCIEVAFRMSSHRSVECTHADHKLIIKSGGSGTIAICKCPDPPAPEKDINENQE